MKNLSVSLSTISFSNDEKEDGENELEKLVMNLKETEPIKHIKKDFSVNSINLNNQKNNVIEYLENLKNELNL